MNPHPADPQTPVLPGPPYRPGHPINYGDLFTFKDYLSCIEQVSGDITYDVAMQMLDQGVLTQVFAPFAIFEDGTWLYRFVPPEERGMVPVRIVLYERGL